MPHHYPLLIKEQHLDCFGHVNNAMYLTLFEEARWDWVTGEGFGLERIQALGLGPVVLACEIQFLREVRLRQEMLIVSNLLSYEKKVGKLKQSMQDAQGKLYCEAVFTFGLFDLTARKLVPPPKDWLKALGWHSM